MAQVYNVHRVVSLYGWPPVWQVCIEATNKSVFQDINLLMPSLLPVVDALGAIITNLAAYYLTD